MGWVDRLRGTVTALDTAPLIYLIEAHPAYLSRVRPFFEALDSGEFRAVASVITLLEVLVHPLRRGDVALAQRYRDVLSQSTALTLVPVSEAIAEEAAQLRATYGLRTPDAIQLATASAAGATAHLTNDGNLPSLPHLRIIVLDHLH